MLRRLVLCLAFIGAAGVASAQPVYTPPSGSAPGSQCNSAGQAPVWSGSAWSCGTLYQIKRLAADFSVTSGTAYADVTGMTFTLAANTNYSITCAGFASSAAGTTALRISLNGPASPTALSFVESTAAVTTGLMGSSTELTAYDADNTFTGLFAGAATLWTLNGTVENGANAGTLALRLKSEIDTSQVTLKRGSYCVVY